MSIIDVLIAPGAAIGCVVGVGAAALLHWFFPTEDLLVVQALLVVFFTIVGHVVAYQLEGRPPER
jgi:hypothetical protein